MSACSGRRLPGRVLLGAVGALAWLVAVVMPAAAAERIAVSIDEARILKLPDRAATIVVGNPLIADLSVQPGGVAVVTGKGFGMTNIVAMDRSGAVLMERNVEVGDPRGRLVVVYKGIEQETYSCAPTCQRRPTLGDSPAFLNATLTEIGTRNAQAMAGGSGGAPGR